MRRGKAIIGVYLSVCLSVCCCHHEIARPWNLGLRATCKCNQSVVIGKRLAWMYYELFGMVHGYLKKYLFVTHRGHANRLYPLALLVRTTSLVEIINIIVIVRPCYTNQDINENHNVLVCVTWWLISLTSYRSYRQLIVIQKINCRSIWVIAMPDNGRLFTQCKLGSMWCILSD